jgi:predicted RNase H-like HicB family nuclease
MIDVLIKVVQRPDQMFHGRCDEVFGFNLVAESIEEMMKEAPSFAQAFFGDLEEVRISWLFLTRQAKRIKVVIELGTTLYIAKSPDLSGLMAVAPLDSKETLHKEIRDSVHAILEARGELNMYNYQIQIEDFT